MALCTACGFTRTPGTSRLALNLGDDECNGISCEPATGVLSAPAEMFTRSGFVTDSSTSIMFGDQARNDFPDNNTSWTVQEETGVVEISNPSACREMHVLVNAGGRARVDTINDEPPNTQVIALNLQVRATVDGTAGAWTTVAGGALYSKQGDARSQENNVGNVFPPVVIPPGRSATFDRRARYRWELSQEALQSLTWNLPSIALLGVTGDVI